MTSRFPLFATLFLIFATSLASLMAAFFNLSLFLPLAVGSSIIAVFLCFTRPLIFLSLLFFVRMITDYTSQNMSVEFFDISFSLSKILGVGIALLGVPMLLKYRQRLRSFPLLIPFLLLSLWGSASLFFSIDPAKTLQDLIRVFDIFIISFIAFVSIQNVRDFQTFLLVILGASVIPIFTGLVQFVLGIGLQDDSVSIARIYGTFAHPNVYSLYLFSVIVCAILFLLLTHETFYKKMRLSFGTLVLVVGGIALILTFARVAWVVLFFFLTVLSLWKYPKLLLPIIFIPVIIFASSSTLQDRVTQTFAQSSDSSVSWRTEIWHDMIYRTLSENRQWYGYGLEAFPTAAEQFRGTKLGSNDAHDDYVKFFVEGGFIGLAIFLTYLFLIFRSMHSRYKASHPDTKIILGILMIFFVSLTVASLTDNIFKNTPLLWVFFSLLGGALAVHKQERKLTS